MSDFITPTVGRVVWYYPPEAVGIDEFDHPMRGEPLAAVIAKVLAADLVNLSVIDASGVSRGRCRVKLVQDGEDVAVDSEHCTWMPFQKGQAKAQGSMYEALQSTEVIAARVAAATKGAHDLANQSAAILESIGARGRAPLAVAQIVNDAWANAKAHSHASRRDDLEVELVIGASRALAENPSMAKQLAEGVKDFLNVLHPVVSPNLINLPPLAAGSTIDVMVSEAGGAERLTSYKLEPKAGIETAITSAALPPAADAHIRNVLYGAIKAAMEELGELHPGFNDHVNRAWNHLHRAFWSEVPAPVSAPGLRDPLPSAEPGIEASDAAASGPGPLRVVTKAEHTAVERLFEAKGQSGRIAPSIVRETIAARRHHAFEQVEAHRIQVAKHETNLAKEKCDHRDAARVLSELDQWLADNPASVRAA